MESLFQSYLTAPHTLLKHLCLWFGLLILNGSYGMGQKKVPVFRNTLPCNGNFAFRVRFRSILQFPMFLLLCQHLKRTVKRTA